MNYIYLLLFINSVYTFNFNKYYYNYNKNDYNHLDNENIRKIENILANNKNYSPYKKYNLKKNINNTDTNIDTNTNLTKILQDLNEQFINIYNSQSDIEDDFDYFENFNKNKKNKKNGYIDETGVFRYNINNKKKSDNQNINQNNNDEFSSENNFEIIKNSKYSFKDIGGYDKIKLELLQSADLLLNHEKYQKFNVRTPKGIIFEGPPGNGKTLMAKCFSGELNISFIPVSGSEFSEKYVGVGASRVRDLFKLASNNKPCIIFIDEIDAVARKRGNDMVSSNSEKDQTLNQLLINLDGFKSYDGIFLIGATNRIDLLDPALIRPGRIDKNIFIGNPDSKTRTDIINIHLKGKPIDEDITISYIVEMTSGFSGAQIENLLNEAMLHALRDNREIINLKDLDYIANRIMVGFQATENKYSDETITRIAIHEMGHAIVGFFSAEHSNLVKVILNLWSPKTPGYTIFENSDEDSNIYTKNNLFSHLMVLLGGRIAEEVFYGYSVTTGAKKDLEEAYSLAQNMILHYGMGSKTIYPDMSDKSKYLIDQEINKLLIDAQNNAICIIENSKDLIIDCSDILKSKNILKPEDIFNIINSKYSDIWDINELKKYKK